MNNKINLEKSSEDIDHLSLLDPALFIFAALNCSKFADLLIEPIMEQLQIKDYRIILTNFDILEVYGLKYTPVLSSAIITGEGKRLIIDIVNIPDYYEVFKRLRAIRSLNINSFVEKNDGDYNKLPETITVCYSDKLVNDNLPKIPVSILFWKNSITGEKLSEFPESIFINNEYKNEEDQNFINLVEDLAQTSLKNIKNPILKEIHFKAKETKEGQNKLFEIIHKLNK